MGDVDRRRAGRAVEGHQFLLHRLAQVRVQVGQRFVHQDRLRPLRQAPGQRHALALAAGQIGGPAGGEGGQGHGRQVPVGLPCGIGARQPRRLGREGHVAAHVQMRPERVGLEDEAHAAPFGGDVQARPGDRRIAQRDPPGIRRLEPRDQPQKRRFPAARGPHDGEEVTRPDLRRHARDGGFPGIGFGDVLQRDRHGGRFPRVKGSARGNRPS